MTPRHFIRNSTPDILDESSDLSLVCQDGKVSGHQWILAKHSTFLKRLFEEESSLSTAELLRSHILGLPDYLKLHKKKADMVHLYLPDHSSREVKQLISLLYDGQTSAISPLSDLVQSENRLKVWLLVQNLCIDQSGGLPNLAELETIKISTKTADTYPDTASNCKPFLHHRDTASNSQASLHQSDTASHSQSSLHHRDTNSHSVVDHSSSPSRPTSTSSLSISSRSFSPTTQEVATSTTNETDLELSPPKQPFLSSCGGERAEVEILGKQSCSISSVHLNSFPKRISSSRKSFGSSTTNEGQKIVKSKLNSSSLHGVSVKPSELPLNPSGITPRPSQSSTNTPVFTSNFQQCDSNRETSSTDSKPDSKIKEPLAEGTKSAEDFLLTTDNIKTQDLELIDTDQDVKEVDTDQSLVESEVPSASDHSEFKLKSAVVKLTRLNLSFFENIQKDTSREQADASATDIADEDTESGCLNEDMEVCEIVSEQLNSIRSPTRSRAKPESLKVLFCSVDMKPQVIEDHERVRRPSAPQSTWKEAVTSSCDFSEPSFDKVEEISSCSDSLDDSLMSGREKEPTTQLENMKRDVYSSMEPKRTKHILEIVEGTNNSSKIKNDKNSNSQGKCKKKYL
jgi:hypothetical protein